MKLLKHYSIFGKANSYIIGNEAGGDAILVDPSVMDINMLNLIEDNNFYIKYILITHFHKNHIEGLRTIKKIYDAQIYSYYSHASIFDSNSLINGEEFSLCGMGIKAIHILGHSIDSIVYKIGTNLFVGDVISAGLIGQTASKLEEELLIDQIKEKLFILEDHVLVLPGHGPPSILGIEKKMFNLYAPLK